MVSTSEICSGKKSEVSMKYQIHTVYESIMNPQLKENNPLTKTSSNSNCSTCGYDDSHILQKL